MKLLFINSATKAFHDREGNYYINPHITNEGFRVYTHFCSSFKLLLRDCGEISEEEKRKYEKFDKSIGQVILYPNIYTLKSFLNINVRNKLEKIIDDCVNWADKIICGSQAGTVIDITCETCKRHHKPYMIYCLGFVWEGQWYHSLKGKLVAYPREWSAKKRTKEAAYALYVTQKVCQERYPCNGKSLGCSDVEIGEPDNDIMSSHIKKLSTVRNRKIILGTSAALDVQLKGQSLMIKALAILKKKGYDIEYRLLGLGEGRRLKKLSNRLGIEENVIFLGGCPHSEVFNFYDSIDIYVHPSYTEGLCRSIIEAMSRACPVVCANVGGNRELIEQEYMFQRGNVDDLVCKIEKILDSDNLIKSAERNFEEVKVFYQENVRSQRALFIKEYINS